MRTPLLGSLRRIVADIRAARQRGVPVDAIREERARAAEQATSRGISRRALLGGAAAAATALTVMPKRARAAVGDPEIAIIGAGMAGMACARILDRRGVSFKVYEASGRIGGRMYTNDSGYWDAGQITEWGGELIDTNHKRVRKLAAEYGLVLDDLLAAQVAGAEELYHVGGAHYAKHDADADFQAMFDVVQADEQAAGYPTLYNDFNQAGRDLDRMSVYDWIESRVPGGHSSRLGKVLDVAYLIEYGAETRDQSALNLLYLLAYQPKPVKFSSFGESDERFHIRGGNQQLPKAIAHSLPAGTVQMGQKLVKLKRTPTGRTTCTFESGGSTWDKTFDWVVLCLPFAVLADVDYSQAGFDPLKLRAISELGRGKSGKLQLQFNQRIWAGSGAWPGVANGSTFSDLGYQCSWEPTRAQPGTPGVLNLFTGGATTAGMKTPVPFATSASNQKVVQDANWGLSKINQVFPGLQWNGKATQSIWHLNPYAKHGYAYYKVGQYVAFGGYERARQNGVLFAGDHTSQDFQGFMEGATTEGERAGQELLTLL